MTDKADYMPGETVVITGTGWLPGETVNMVIDHLTFDHPDQYLSAVASSDGNIYNNSYVIDPSDLGETFLLTATGLSSGLTATTTFTDAPPAADIDQVRNGSKDSPVSPGDWVNGNAGKTNSHYAEGYSVPYRVVMTNMPADTEVTLTLGYDVTHSSVNAIDYLTHYDRLEPHLLGFGHIAEVIDPTIGVSGLSGSATSTFDIPSPPAYNTPVTGQPTGSFEMVSSGDGAYMSMWNGEITDISYGAYADLSLSQAEQQINVTFTTGSVAGQTIILAWGGHIASRVDWGYFEDGVTPRSAGGISGSPYHMRLKDWTLGTLGNQDRSLSADAVIPPPSCSLEGPSSVCEGTDNVYTVTASNAPDPYYSWELLDNTTGAVIITGQGTNEVTVNAGTDGGYTIKVTISDINGSSSCEILVTVNPNPTANPATLKACDDGDGIVDFILTDATSTVIGSQTDVTVTYHATESEAIAGTNPLSSPYASLNKTIYARVETLDGCFDISEVSLVVNPLITVSVDDEAVCYGEDVTFTATAGGGTGTYTYVWSVNSVVQTDVTGNTLTLTGVTADATIAVTVDDDFVSTQGAEDCTATDDASLDVNLEINVTVNSETVCEGESIQLTASASGGTAPYYYLWSTGATTESITVDEEGTYTVTVTDSFTPTIGDPCTGFGSGTLTIVPCSWISLKKTTGGSVNPSMTWTFELYQGTDMVGDPLATQTTFNDPDGILFDDYGPLSIYESYTVCEKEVPAGYGTTWYLKVNSCDTEVPFALIPYTLPGVGGVFNPNYDDDPQQDQGNRCYTIEGSNLPVNSYTDDANTSPDDEDVCIFQLEVDNTFPGGAPRTPGYWKNWNTCTGGGQQSTATANSTDKNGDGIITASERVASGRALLDDILELYPISWGDFEISSCAIGVSILDQRDINTGKKMASDAAYTLAMHLLAYQLNQSAGAYVCPDMLPVETEAVSLLDGIGFDGTGAYLRKGTVYARALQLAALLDEYNNMGDSQVCPIVPEPELMTFTTGKPPKKMMSVPESDELSVQIQCNVYPNPFEGTVNFEVMPKVSTQLRLEVFSITGQCVAIVYDGDVQKDVTYRFEFSSSSYIDNVFIYRLRTNTEIKTGRLIRLR
ncbi:MAG: T9SS type A sorting domain-containing protein [Bacteroidales bacterium]|nr:T9SS type A sorting domain-containing protein [Bacteroidales bacterium]